MGGGLTDKTPTQDESSLFSREVAQALTSNYGKQPDNSDTAQGPNLVAHSLRADGFDASEDGTGRGTPLIAVLRGHSDYGDGAPSLRADGGDCGGGSEALIAFQTRGSNLDVDKHTTGTIGENSRSASGCAPMIAFSCKDSGNDAQPEVSPTLRAMGHAESHPNAGGQIAIAFNARQDPDVYTGHTGPLDTDGGTQAVHVATMAVRRLTPLECTRLQGFPDDYFDGVIYRGKKPADGVLYKALGNSMATNAMRLIGERIQSAMQ